MEVPRGAFFVAGIVVSVLLGVLAAIHLPGFVADRVIGDKHVYESYVEGRAPVVNITAYLANGSLVIYIKSPVSATCKIAGVGTFGPGVHRVPLDQVVGSRGFGLRRHVECRAGGIKLAGDITVPGKAVISPPGAPEKVSFTVTLRRSGRYFAVAATSTKDVCLRLVAGGKAVKPPALVPAPHGNLKLRVMWQDVPLHLPGNWSTCTITGAVYLPKDYGTGIYWLVGMITLVVVVESFIIPALLYPFLGGRFYVDELIRGLFVGVALWGVAMLLFIGPLWHTAVAKMAHVAIQTVACT